MRSRVFPLVIISLFTPICFVALQTPHSTQAAFASASQQPQDRVRQEASEACPVTKPPAHPFVPPPPYWTDHGRDGFWYGTESLWTLLGVSGTWNLGETEGVYRTKLTYFGNEVSIGGRTNQISPSLRNDLTAKCPLAADPAHAVFVTTERPGIMTVIDIPSTGCWELTAQYGGHRLSFVISVQP
jgi:hypothetical protein